MAGRFLDIRSDHEHVVRNAGAVGECQMGTRILNLDFETFVGDMVNE